MHLTRLLVHSVRKQFGNFALWNRRRAQVPENVWKSGNSDSMFHTLSSNTLITERVSRNESFRRERKFQNVTDLPSYNAFFQKPQWIWMKLDSTFQTLLYHPVRNEIKEISLKSIKHPLDQEMNISFTEAEFFFFSLLSNMTLWHQFISMFSAD